MENSQRLVESFVPYKRDRLSIIIGMLLGDAGIVTKYPYNLVLCHSEMQKEYLLFKCGLLRQLGFKQNKIRTMNKKLKYCVYIVDMQHEQVRWFFEKMYKDGKKRITYIMLRHLTPKGMAIWYMDDGNLVHRSIYKAGKKCDAVCLNTQSFTDDEQNMIRKWLKNKYNIKSKLHKDKKYHKIYIPAESGRIFLKLIQPYIHHSMEYKLR